MQDVRHICRLELQKVCQHEKTEHERLRYKQVVDMEKMKFEHTYELLTSQHELLSIQVQLSQLRVPVQSASPSASPFANQVPLRKVPLPRMFVTTGLPFTGMSIGTDAGMSIDSDSSLPPPLALFHMM